MLSATAKTLRDTVKRLTPPRGKLASGHSRVLFVDDGSRDETWQIVEQLCSSDKLFCGLKLSRNFVNQNAWLAGLMLAKQKADVVISMDADLQDDINAIDKMLKEYHNGSDIVYGVRSNRRSDGLMKRGTAGGFYKLAQLIGIELIPNHADFRLMSRRALDELAKFDETNLFLRGIVPQLGLPSSIVEYKRQARSAGHTKYTPRKMLSFAWNGITSLSVKPLRLISALGVIMFVVSFAVLVYALIAKLTNRAVSGWTFTICSIWMLAGVQMLSIGVVGEYIGKIYGEVKRRPRYIVEKTLE
jgi:glycosyltransferase involved in cell wall biosynthesis